VRRTGIALLPGGLNLRRWIVKLVHGNSSMNHRALSLQFGRLARGVTRRMRRLATVLYTIACLACSEGKSRVRM
jgi:hypothetical protein